MLIPIGLGLAIVALIIALVALVEAKQIREQIPDGRLRALEQRVEAMARYEERLSDRINNRSMDVQAIFHKLDRRYSAICGLYDHLGLTYDRIDDFEVAVYKVKKIKDSTPKPGLRQKALPAKTK